MISQHSTAHSAGTSGNVERPKSGCRASCRVTFVLWSFSFSRCVAPELNERDDNPPGNLFKCSEATNQVRHVEVCVGVRISKRKELRSMQRCLSTDQIELMDTLTTSVWNRNLSLPLDDCWIGKDNLAFFLARRVATIVVVVGSLVDTDSTDSDGCTFSRTVEARQNGKMTSWRAVLEHLRSLSPSFVIPLLWMARTGLSITKPCRSWMGGTGIDYQFVHPNHA